MNIRILSLLFFALFTQSAFTQTNVIFSLDGYLPKVGDKIGIRGNSKPLDWDTSIEMLKTDSNFVKQIQFSNEIKAIEYKFVVTNGENVVWESIENRTQNFADNKEITSKNIWNAEPVIDITTLKPLQRDDLLKDFELIKTMILEVHPGTYRYNDSISIQTSLNELEQQIQSPLTHQEFYLGISKLLAKIQCGHTFASFYNQGSLMKSILHQQKNKLPFTFEWINQKMIVTYDATLNNQLKRGAEIVKIDGIPTIDILKKLMPYVSTDGATDKSRISKLNVSGYDFNYDDFDVFYPLLFNSIDENIQLEVKEYQSTETKNIIVNSTSLQERSEILQEKYSEFPKSNDDLWNFKIIDQNTALLTLNSFTLMGWKSLTIDYKEFLAATFKKIKQEKIGNLIIDIRQNDGGNDEIVEELYSYFDINKITRNEQEGRTRYLEFPESLKKFIDTWGEPWYYNLKNENPTFKYGYYIFKDAFIVDKLNKKKKDYFTGKIYLLTSPNNESLAYYLAKNIKTDSLGKLIGQETGGNLRGINGGQILFLKLPFSNIEIDFPILGDFTKSMMNNSGIMPDIETTITQKDIAESFDKVIEETLKIMQ